MYHCILAVSSFPSVFHLFLGELYLGPIGIDFVFLFANSKNCPNFKKLFPEYVAKYEQLRAPEQSISKEATNREQSSPPAAALESTGLEGTDMVVADNARDRRQTNKVPLWLLMVLLSVFGAVMTLPLLQL